LNQLFDEANPELEPVNNGSFRRHDYRDATKENLPNRTHPCKAYTSTEADWWRLEGARCAYCCRETFRGSKISGHFVCLTCSVELHGVRAELEKSRCRKQRDVRVVRGEWGSVLCDVDWEKGTANLMPLSRGNRRRGIENMLPGSASRVIDNVTNYLAKDSSFQIEVTRRAPGGFVNAAGKGSGIESRLAKTASSFKGVRGRVVDSETGRVVPRIAYELKRKLTAGGP